jgi:hypothetical protein
MSIGSFTENHKILHILTLNLFLNLTLHIQYTHKSPHINRPIYQIPYKTPYITRKVISDPHTPYSVYTQTSPCLSYRLLNTIQTPFFTLKDIPEPQNPYITFTQTSEYQ